MPTPSPAPPGPAVPPDVDALHAASRRLLAHADLVEGRYRLVSRQAQEVRWTSQAATALLLVLTTERTAVAAQCEELRDAADELARYARHVAEARAARAATLPAASGLMPQGTT